MDENIQPIPPGPSAEPIAPATTSSLLAARKSKKWIWIIIGAVVVTILCAIVVGVVIVTGVLKVAQEKAPIEAVLDQYMHAMQAKDVEAAYDLFSPRAKRQFSIDELQKLISKNAYAVFETYQELSVEQWNIGATVNADQDLPQGTVATVSGTTSYTDGFSGTFNGTLEKVDGTWMIHGIFVNIPFDKFEP